MKGKKLSQSGNDFFSCTLCHSHIKLQQGSKKRRHSKALSGSEHICSRSAFGIYHLLIITKVKGLYRKKQSISSDFFLNCLFLKKHITPGSSLDSGFRRVTPAKHVPYTPVKLILPRGIKTKWVAGRDLILKLQIKKGFTHSPFLLAAPCRLVFNWDLAEFFIVINLKLFSPSRALLNDWCLTLLSLNIYQECHSKSLLQSKQSAVSRVLRYFFRQIL